MKNKITSISLIAMLGFSFVASAAINVNNLRNNVILPEYTESFDPTTRTITYTINENADGEVVINSDTFAIELMKSVTEPSEYSQINVKVINNSENTYYFGQMDFKTENTIKRDVEVKTPDLPEFIRTEPLYDDVAATNARGFDGNLIPYSMNILRCITKPLMDLYGVKTHPSDVTLLQVQNATKTAQEKGYKSYADYLLQYYKHKCSKCSNAKTLYELEPIHISEILGSAVGDMDGQSEIRNPRFISKQDIQDNDYALFRTYGWGAYRDFHDIEYIYQDYEYMETEEELIELGYWYLYDYGIRLSLNNQKFPIITDDEIDSGYLSIYDYIYKTGKTQQVLKSLFEDFELKPDDEIIFNDMEFTAQLPNSYDLRAIDWGLDVTITTEKPPEEPEPETPDPETPDPETPDPETPEPETPDPKTPEPETPEPKTPEPETPDPKTTDPETPDPETPEPETSEEPPIYYIPPLTGDNSNMILWFIVMLVSGCGLLVVIYLRKKE